VNEFTPSGHVSIHDALNRVGRELFPSDWTGARGGVIRQYLGQSHRDKAEKGCAFATLTPEIARQDKGTRTILEEELEAYIGHHRRSRRRN